MKNLRTAIATSLLIACATLGSGCALIDAAGREAQDDGKDAVYHNRNFGQHMLDSLRGKDDRKDRRYGHADSRCSRCVRKHRSACHHG